jgi:hypothetical protein
MLASSPVDSLNHKSIRLGIPSIQSQAEKL